MEAAMTPKEVYAAVVNFEEPDRIPISISAHDIIRRQQGITLEQYYLLPPKEQAEFSVDVHRTYGGDVIRAGFNGTLAIKAIGGKVKFRDKGHPDVEEPLVRDIADLDKINLDTLKQDFHYQVCREASKEIVALAGEEYCVSSGSWGPFTQAGLIFGAEPLMRNCLRDKEAVRALLDFTFELIKAYSEEIIELGIDVGTLADPSASGDMVSKKTFEEFALPWLKKTFDWHKSKGLSTSLHICGDVTDRLDLLPESNADVMSLDYKVSMKKAAEILGDKIVIGGNVNPAGTLMTGDQEEVRRAYLDIFEQVEGAPYVLMAGCGIPAGVPISNIEVMRDLAYSAVPHYTAKAKKQPLKKLKG
jgi:uroporphyrinogen decarboxylase